MEPTVRCDRGPYALDAYAHRCALLQVRQFFRQWLLHVAFTLAQFQRQSALGSFGWQTVLYFIDNPRHFTLRHRKLRGLSRPPLFHSDGIHLEPWSGAELRSVDVHIRI